MTFLKITQSGPDDPGAAVTGWAATDRLINEPWIDFGQAMRDKSDENCLGEILEMDTSNLDKQAKAHLAFYYNFMTASKIVTGLIILTLVIMAATLL